MQLIASRNTEIQQSLQEVGKQEERTQDIRRWAQPCLCHRAEAGLLEIIYLWTADQPLRCSPDSTYCAAIRNQDPRSLGVGMVPAR